VPASPHQVAVLTPRPRTTRAATVSSSVTPVRLMP